MKQCTGERYNGEFQSLSSINGWHGKFGHLNVLKLDHDDICTHYGIHDRVVTTLPQYHDEINSIGVYCRVDHVWGLGMPTEKQIINIMRKHDNTKGRYKIAKIDRDDKSTDLWLIKQ